MLNKNTGNIKQANKNTQDELGEIRTTTYKRKSTEQY